MNSFPDTESQILAMSQAWLREYSDWFSICDRKWWRRHEILGSWSTVGARDLAGQRVSDAVTKLDLPTYQWAYGRSRQPFTVKRVLDKVMPHITRLELPGPPVDIDPQVVEAYFRFQNRKQVGSAPGTRSTEETA